MPDDSLKFYMEGLLYKSYPASPVLGFAGYYLKWGICLCVIFISFVPFLQSVHDDMHRAVPQGLQSVFSIQYLCRC